MIKYINQSSYQVVNLTEICVDSECLTQNWVNNLGIWATLVRLVADAIWLAYLVGLGPGLGLGPDLFHLCQHHRCHPCRQSCRRLQGETQRVFGGALQFYHLLANCPAAFLSYFHCGFVMKYSRRW